MWVVVVGVSGTGLAVAGPGAGAAARAKYQVAVQLINRGNTDQALAVIDEGLTAAPQDAPLLGLKGRVLLAMHDYPGALAAYEAYLTTGVTGANQRQAQQIVDSLSAVRTTFLDISVNGPAAIYLDSRTQGVFCTGPACHKPILPGDYKVIAERPGFELWTGRLSVAPNAAATLAIALVEKPSRLTVRVAQPGARVTVDGAAYEAPANVAAGAHRIAVTLTGHRSAQLDAAAHEGQPVTVDVALVVLTPVRVEPSGASLAIDGKPVALEDGGIAIPPGDHELVAIARGYLARRVKLAANRSPGDELVITLDRVPPPAPPAPPPPPGLTLRRKLALAAVGLGVAAAGTGSVLGVLSGRDKNSAFALCPSPATPCSRAAEADRSYDRGRSRAIEADIGFGVAAAAALAAAVLWLGGAPESRVTASPRIGPVAGLDLAVRF